MEIKEIEYGSCLYDEIINLRDLVLRKPIGLSIKDDDLSKEPGFIHIGVLEEDKIIGTCQFMPLSSTRVRMKQVCIHPTMQGKNIGTKMFEFALALLASKGIKEVEVHARATALKYYEKNGFKAIGEPFTEVGIKHYYMERLV